MDKQQPLWMSVYPEGARPKPQPIWMRLYTDPALYKTARVVGYGGVPRSRLEAAIAPLVAQFGSQRVESALRLLTTFRLRSAPMVQLRKRVRPLCFQLLGPAPEDPEFRTFYPEGRGPKPEETTE
jgi:hypothetical protein